MPDPFELRADHSLLTLFPLLCRKDCHRSGAAQPIPHTVAYQYGFFKAWYYYDMESGEIAEREKKYSTPDDIFEVFSKGPDQCVAVFLYRKAGFLAEVTEQEATSVEFLSREGLAAFLGKVGPRPDGLLQKFVSPNGANNAVIQALWSPHVTVLTLRKNIHSLGDRRLPLHDRLVTHEGSQHLSREVRCTNELVRRFAEVCQRLAEHCATHNRVMLHRMVLFFKIDAQDRAVLLWPSSIIASRGLGRRIPGAKGLEDGQATAKAVPSAGLADVRSEPVTGADLAQSARYTMPTRRLLLNLSPNFSNPREVLRRQQDAVQVPEGETEPYCVVPEAEDTKERVFLATVRETLAQQQRAMREVLRQTPDDNRCHRRLVPSKVRRRLLEAQQVAATTTTTQVSRPSVPSAPRRLGTGWRRQQKGPGSTRSKLLPDPPLDTAPPKLWMHLPPQPLPSAMSSSTFASSLLAELSLPMSLPMASGCSTERDESDTSPVETTPCTTSPTDCKGPGTLDMLGAPLDLDALLSLFTQPLRGTRCNEVSEWLDDLAYKAYHRPLERRGSFEFTVPRIVRKYLGADLAGLAHHPGIAPTSSHSYWVDLRALPPGTLTQEIARIQDNLRQRFHASEGAGKALRDTPWDTDSSSDEDIKF
eukprot:GGOE01002462.1.p1 GENE.GGOE01002462.1~~GGOE01002462.1.p1  ORF type:complete len:646 (+),score=123.73 GGOE01002462.1:58-1995(+)